MIAFDLIHAKTTFAISITCDCEFYKFKYKFHDFIIQNAPLFSERRVSAGVGWIAPLIASHYHHVLPIFHSGASSLARGACVILKIAFTKYLPSTRKKKRNKKSNTCLLAIYAFRYNDICRPFAVVLFGRSVKNDPLAQYAPQLKMLQIHFLDATLLLSLNWYVFFENKYW